MRRPILSTAVCSSLIVLALVFATGCPPGGDPLIRQAESTCRETMAEDPQYAAYAVAEAAASESSLASEIVRQAIDSEDFDQSLAAVRGLADDPDADDQALLKQAFDQKKGPVRLWAAIGLGRLGEAEAIEWLESQLTELGGPIRSDAALVLARQGKSDVVKDMLSGMIGSDDQAVQDEAYGILGRIGDPWAVEMLLAGLKGEHGEARREAIAALGRTGDREAAMKIARFANTQGLVFATLEALGEMGHPDTKPTVQAMMKQEEPLAKVYAGVALWKLGGVADPLTAIGPLTGSPDAGVRRALAEQLGSIEDDTGSVQLLIALLEDQADADVRLAAARSLRTLNPEGIAPYLVTAASDADYRVATTALAALRGSNDEAIPEQLLPLLDHENPYVRVSAAMTVLDVRERSSATTG